MKYTILIIAFFFFGNLQAIKFISLIDGQTKELPDCIRLKNDLDEKVDIKAHVYLLDGCFPLAGCIPEKADYCFEGPDAWGLYHLQIIRSKTPFMLRFPHAESVVRSIKSTEKFELVICVSAIIKANLGGTMSFAEIRTPKK